jgi:hypothetical protein
MKKWSCSSLHPSWSRDELHAPAGLLPAIEPTGLDAVLQRIPFPGRRYAELPRLTVALCVCVWGGGGPSCYTAVPVLPDLTTLLLAVPSRKSHSLSTVVYFPTLFMGNLKRPCFSSACPFIHGKYCRYPIEANNKIFHSSKRPWSPTGLWDAEASKFTWQSAHRWRWGCHKPFTSRKIPGTHFC